MAKMTRRRRSWQRVQREPVGPPGAGSLRFPMFGSADPAIGDFAIWISSGGWCGRRWMTATEMLGSLERWVTRAYFISGPAYADKVASEGGSLQCGGCRYFGAFDADYGLCCNPASAMDGRVTFEHAGCPQHSNVEEENSAT